MKVFKYNINLSFKRSKEKTSFLPYVYNIEPTLLLRYFNHPYNNRASNTRVSVVNGANRNRVIEVTSLMMVRKHNDNIQVINIPQVPYDAIRDYIIKKNEPNYLCRSFYPSYYNKKIESEYDKNKISNNQQSFIYDIANLIAQDILSSFTNNNQDFNQANSLLIEENIKKYAFYFMYDNVNYKDAYIFATANFINANNNLIKRNFILRVAYSEYVTNSPTLSSVGEVTFIHNSQVYKEISKIFDYLVPINFGFYIDGVKKDIHFSYLYHPFKGIIKDVNNIKDFFVVENNNFAGTPFEQVYKYYDYSAQVNSNCNVMGHGFIIDQRKIKTLYGNNNDVLDHTYISTVYVTSGGLFQYVPYLTGLLRFLIAVHLGFEPVMLIKNNAPSYSNIEKPYGKINIKDRTIDQSSIYHFDTIIEAYSLNINYTQYIERYYQKRLDLVCKYKDSNNFEDRFYFVSNNNKIIREVNNMTDFHRFFEEYDSDYSILYLNENNFDLLLKYVQNGYLRSGGVVSSSYGDVGFRFLFEYVTDIEQEPCFLDSFDEIVKQVTNEENPITISGSPIDMRYYMTRFPCLIIYNSDKIKQPPTMKRMDIYYDHQNNTYSDREYVYNKIEDKVRWGDYPLDSYDNIFYNKLLVDISGGNVEPPVIDEKYVIGDLFSFINFSFITSKDILKYPSIFEFYDNPFPNTFYYEKNSNIIGPSANKVRVYWREYMYNKYIRYIINYAIHYALYMYYENINETYAFGKDIVSFKVYRSDVYTNEYGAQQVNLNIDLVLKYVINAPVEEVEINLNVSL